VGDPNAPVAYSKQILWKGKELWAVMAWRDAAFVRNWKDFQDRAQHMAMGYNWFYSDVAGNIGWLFNGHFPPPPEVMKALPGYRDTRLPLAGALAVAPVVGRPLYDLKKPESADGFRSYNPPSGYIVNWNNKPTLVYQNRDLYINRWSQGNRSNLLDTFVQAEIGATKANITAHEVIENVYKAATMRDVNFDAFAPLLRAVDPTSVTDKDTRDALLLLQKWNGLREPEKNGTGQYTGKFQGPEVPILTAWVTMLVDEYVGGPLWTKYKLGSLVSPNDGGLSGYMYSTPSIPAPNAMRGSLSMSPGNQVILRALQDRLELRPLDRPKFDVLQKNSAADAMIKVLYKAVAKLKKDQGPHMETWRQPMVVQNFFAENYEKIPTSIDRKVSLPWSANRGVMQRIAVGSKQGMVSQDANPPGECGEFTSKHYQDQVEIYGNYGFKPLQLHPQLPAGQIVALTSKL
jgi:penicillin amidase